MARAMSQYTDMAGFLTADQRRAAAAKKSCECEKDEDGKCQFCGTHIQQVAIQAIVERFGILVCGGCQLKLKVPEETGYSRARVRLRELQNNPSCP